MTLTAAVGQAQAIGGREAGSQAALQALNQLGRSTPSFGFVFASHDYAIQEVLDGVTTPLADTPLLGFSTCAEITSGGHSRRSVVVALLAGNEIQAKAGWWPGLSGNVPVEGAVSASQKMLDAIQPSQSGGILLVVADGLNEDTGQLERQLSAAYQYNYEARQGNNKIPSLTITGCLTAGDLRHGRTAQIGGQKSGNGGTAGALITGKITTGIGTAHGCHPTGSYFHITQKKGNRIYRIDGHPAVDKYAELFGYEQRDWYSPPLNEFVRLYPFGIERGQEQGHAELEIHSPVCVEADGSLHMNTEIPEGSIAHLMMGSAAGCQEAARQAVHQALLKLAESKDRARPALAVLFVDASWASLLEGQPGLEVQAVQSILGEDIPIVGGYTYGQIAFNPIFCTTEVLNQHILVVLFKEIFAE